MVYHDSESAEICKRELGDRYYKGRALTITTEAKKSHQLTPISPDEELLRQIGTLRREERQVLLGLMRNMREEGKIFEAFLESRPKVTEALLRGE